MNTTEHTQTESEMRMRLQRVMRVYYRSIGWLLDYSRAKLEKEDTRAMDGLRLNNWELEAINIGARKMIRRIASTPPSTMKRSAIGAYWANAIRRFTYLEKDETLQWARPGENISDDCLVVRIHFNPHPDALPFGNITDSIFYLCDKLDIDPESILFKWNGMTIEEPGEFVRLLLTGRAKGKKIAKRLERWFREFRKHIETMSTGVCEEVAPRKAKVDSEQTATNATPVAKEQILYSLKDDGDEVAIEAACAITADGTPAKIEFGSGYLERCALRLLTAAIGTQSFSMMDAIASRGEMEVDRNVHTASGREKRKEQTDRARHVIKRLNYRIGLAMGWVTSGPDKQNAFSSNGDSVWHCSVPITKMDFGEDNSFQKWMVTENDRFNDEIERGRMAG